MTAPSRLGARAQAPAGLAALVAIQSIAAVFFVADATGDIFAQGLTSHLVFESVVAVALVGGVLAGAQRLRGLLAEARRKEAALAIAAGAFRDVMVERFREWGLTPAEADVAVFALKGCNIGEIAALRGAAPGTVRAQLARIYQKAGVNSRAALASLFLEELLDRPAPEAASAPTTPAPGASDLTAPTPPLAPGARA